MAYTCRIFRPWEHQASYDRLIDWIDFQGPDNVYFGEAYGISYINGKTYRSEVGFKNKEDLLIFKLSFPELA